MEVLVAVPSFVRCCILAVLRAVAAAVEGVLRAEAWSLNECLYLVDAVAKFEPIWKGGLGQRETQDGSRKMGGEHSAVLGSKRLNRVCILSL